MISISFSSIFTLGENDNYVDAPPKSIVNTYSFDSILPSK